MCKCWIGGRAMLLSVVIPFYHVEKYIGACLTLAAQLPAQACLWLWAVTL